MSTLLFLIGLLLLVVGAVAILIAAFEEGMGWFLWCLFVPLVQVIFILRFWDQARKGVYIEVAGLILILISPFLAPKEPLVPDGGGVPVSSLPPGWGGSAATLVKVMLHDCLGDTNWERALAALKERKEPLASVLPPVMAVLDKELAKVVKERPSLYDQYTECALPGLVQTSQDPGAIQPLMEIFRSVRARKIYVKDTRIEEAVIEGLVKIGHPARSALEQMKKNGEQWLVMKVDNALKRLETAKPPVPEPKTEPPTPTEASPEKEAERLLQLAENLLKNGVKDKAAERLREVVSNYPGTPAAARAEELLAQTK